MQLFALMLQVHMTGTGGFYSAHGCVAHSASCRLPKVVRLELRLQLKEGPRRSTAFTQLRALAAKFQSTGLASMAVE
eukprot:5134374-Amphidinium_carterae.1